MSDELTDSEKSDLLACLQRDQTGPEEQQHRAESYGFVLDLILNDPVRFGVPVALKTWLAGALAVNLGSTAAGGEDTFSAMIRSYTAMEVLVRTGVELKASDLQKASNGIADNVIGYVLEHGKLPTLDMVGQDDIEKSSDIFDGSVKPWSGNVLFAGLGDDHFLYQNVLGDPAEPYDDLVAITSLRAGLKAALSVAGNHVSEDAQFVALGALLGPTNAPIALDEMNSFLTNAYGANYEPFFRNVVVDREGGGADLSDGSIYSFVYGYSGDDAMTSHAIGSVFDGGTGSNVLTYDTSAPLNVSLCGGGSGTIHMVGEIHDASTSFMYGGDLYAYDGGAGNDEIYRVDRIVLGSGDDVVYASLDRLDHDLSVDGSGGSNAFTVSSSTGPVVVDMRTGSVSDGTRTIHLDNIGTVTGTRGSDVFYGNGSSTFHGGGGNDEFHVGAGDVVYGNADWMNRSGDRLFVSPGAVVSGEGFGAKFILDLDGVSGMDAFAGVGIPAYYDQAAQRGGLYYGLTAAEVAGGSFAPAAGDQLVVTRSDGSIVTHDPGVLNADGSVGSGRVMEIGVGASQLARQWWGGYALTGAAAYDGGMIGSRDTRSADLLTFGHEIDGARSAFGFQGSSAMNGSLLDRLSHEVFGTYGQPGSMDSPTASAFLVEPTGQVGMSLDVDASGRSEGTLILGASGFRDDARGIDYSLASEHLSGGGGSDVIIGGDGGGLHLLDGGAGNDVLFSRSTFAYMSGGDGDDVLLPNGMSGTVVGGDGFDIVSLAGSNSISGVSASLSGGSGMVSGVGAHGAFTFATSSIEEFIGTSGSDDMSVAGMVAVGGGGADHFTLGDRAVAVVSGGSNVVDVTPGSTVLISGLTASDVLSVGGLRLTGTSSAVSFHADPTADGGYEEVMTRATDGPLGHHETSTGVYLRPGAADDGSRSYGSEENRTISDAGTNLIDHLMVGGGMAEIEFGDPANPTRIWLDQYSPGVAGMDYGADGGISLYSVADDHANFTSGHASSAHDPYGIYGAYSPLPNVDTHAMFGLFGIG